MNKTTQQSNEALIKEGTALFTPTYSQLPLVLDGGKECYVKDIEGNYYLDFTAGIAVNILGYGNEGYEAALIDTIKKGMVHSSNIYWNKNEIDVAKKLVTLSQMDQVFFCNSGTEANEAALKLARKYGKNTGRNGVISMKESFHGRTFGALSTTGQIKYQKNFYPLLGDVSYATFNDLASVHNLVDSNTCAIIVEPLQGEGGIIPATKEFLQGLRKIADEQDLILIFDEVQCGMGRTGKAFCYENFDVIPDVVTLAKALAGGIPTGAMITKGKANNILVAGDHASTFGGNLVAMAGASYILDYLGDKEFLTSVKNKGAYLTDKLLTLKKKYPSAIEDVRGMGLMMGLVMKMAPAPIIAECFTHKLLILRAGTNVIRFVPPLIITEDEIDAGIAILDQAIATCLKSK